MRNLVLCVVFLVKDSCLSWGPANYSETVLSRPHIKRTPPIKWTPAEVPKFSSHIYCKINLHSADTWQADADNNIKPFCCTKPAINRLLLLKVQLTPVTLFSDVISKLSRLFQIDALIDWTLYYASLWSYTVLHFYKRVNSKLFLHNILDPVLSGHPVWSGR